MDIERLKLTYKAKNPSRSVAAGTIALSVITTRHSITTCGSRLLPAGRSCNLFEDSGGLLPVHNVGITATGLVPHTGKLRLHWVVETGNGRSFSNLRQPGQNFYAAKDRKSLNFAAYVKSEWIPGVQIGGSYLRDVMSPDGGFKVNQNIGSFCFLYLNSDWEFLNEGVLLKQDQGRPHI